MGGEPYAAPPRSRLQPGDEAIFESGLVGSHSDPWPNLLPDLSGGGSAAARPDQGTRSAHPAPRAGRRGRGRSLGERPRRRARQRGGPAPPPRRPAGGDDRLAGRSASDDARRRHEGGPGPVHGRVPRARRRPGSPSQAAPGLASRRRPRGRLEADAEGDRRRVGGRPRADPRLDRPRAGSRGEHRSGLPRDDQGRARRCDQGPVPGDRARRWSRTCETCACSRRCCAG